MTWASILAIVEGLLKFPQAILEFINLFKKTPVEKQRDVMAQVRQAFLKADAPGPDGKPSDDVTEIEDIING